jgi:hypothetical protein
MREPLLSSWLVSAETRRYVGEMSGRRIRVTCEWPLFGLVMCLLPAACSHSVRGSRPSPAKAEATASTGAGSGGVEDPSQARCSGSVGPALGGPEPDDFVIGPLRYGSAAAWATMKPPTGVRLPDGRYFYKTGALVRPGAVVTVTVAPRARSYATIVVQGGPGGGSEAVTYSACPHAPETAWPGGFLLARRTACLPLDVSVAGESATRHVVLSVHNGSCGR